MNKLGKLAFAALAIFVLSPAAGAQAATQSACKLDAPDLTASAPNIFNDRQEQDLGDALAEAVESDLRIAQPAADDQLTRVGERLLAALPPSGLRYRFRVYESGEVNGFSIAGGRVYISRKLIAAARNEDELAGVIAHEIGHISTHQTAIEVTRIFRIRLGVTQVGDRADIFARVHQMMSTPPKPHEEEGKEEKGELAADRVGLFAMVRSGYAAESFSSFFDQVSQNKGKTGNWLGDMFGITHESTQRYRSAMKLISELPQGCTGKKPGSSDAFTAWHCQTMDERVKMVAEGVSGDRPMTLDPPLRSSLWRLRFSPDGKWILAQDDGSITVLDRAASKVLFRMDAPYAESAQFTPDSESVVFHDRKLRVERWSVATGRRTSVKELVVFDGCVQTLLAQDGRTLVCINASDHIYSLRLSLRMIDVESGSTVFDKPNFYDASQPGDYYRLLFALRSSGGSNPVNVAVSPGGRYLLTGVGDRAQAFDMQSRAPIPLGGKLKDMGQVRMSFLGPDELLAFGPSKSNGMYEARILSFPEGKVLKTTEVGNQQIDAVTKGQLLMIWPLKDYAVGLFDPNESKVMAASKLSVIDAWDKLVATEDATGGVSIGPLGVADSVRIPLPLGPMPLPRAAVFSPDGKYLAVSMKNRASIWNLETGKQVGLYRPFASAWMDDRDNLFGQFPKFVSLDAKELEFTMSPLGAKELAKLDDEEWQYHDMELRFKALGKDGSTSHHVTFEVKNMRTQKVAWSRDFAHERPACWPAEDDRLVLGWDMGNDAVKDELKSHPALQAMADALASKKKGMLIETVDPENGKDLEQVIIPEVDLTGGWDDVRRAMVSGEFVLVRGEHGNTVIYRLNGGAKMGEFFGSPVATDAATGVIAAVNRENEILLVDEFSGKELKRFTLGSPVRIARIVNGQEKALLVLTADQVVHRLLLPQ